MTASTHKNAPGQGGAIENSFSGDYTGKIGPRERRLLRTLMSGATSREALDRAVGTSNAPDVVMRLRRRGFAIPCEMRDGIDRDGRKCRFGVYLLSAKDASLAARVLTGRE